MNTDALKVVNNPNLSAPQSGLRLAAWAVLMSGRGKRINQFRLQHMQRNLPAVTAMTGLVLHPNSLPPLSMGA